MPFASPRVTVRLCHRATLVALLAMTLTGCDQPDKPITRTVPKAAGSAQVIPAAPTTPAMPASPALVAQAGAIGKPVFPKTPEGWTEQDPGAMRKGSWKVSANGANAELAVTAFPGDVGGRMANINRWRGQLGLEPVTPDFYDAIQIAMVGDAQGELVSIQSKDGARATLAIMASKGGTSWFLKLSGDAVAVEAARAALVKFAAETRLP